jgi:hypothetical protein
MASQEVFLFGFQDLNCVRISLLLYAWYSLHRQNLLDFYYTYKLIFGEEYTLSIISSNNFVFILLLLPLSMSLYNYLTISVNGIA